MAEPAALPSADPPGAPPPAAPPSPAVAESPAAAIAVALFYELCKASNAWIGGVQYREFWTHEAMISTLTFLMTTLFGWAYKCAHPDSK